MRGGCNGARIQFPPLADREENKGLDKVIDYLRPLAKKYKYLSLSDLIVLAGYAANEEAGGIYLPFCGGRVDAKGPGTTIPVREYPTPVVENKDTADIMGLTPREFVALAGRLRSHELDKYAGYGGAYYGTD